MPRNTRAAAVLPLAAAALLAGCASFAPGRAPDAASGAAPDAAFVVLGEDGAAIARVVTTAARCPDIAIDGRAAPMGVRVPHSAIAPRASAPAVASAAVLSCETA